MNTTVPSPVELTPIERLLKPFQRFVQTESSGGIVLLAATVVALLWANLNWDSYHHLWETYVQSAFGDWSIRMTLHHLINDGLMVVFFFLVGLEIKRELLVGELASFRAAALPIAAAAGGMIVPALMYVMLNSPGSPGASGWGIPMATDIAFALGILALMGSRIPLGLKVFLAALAIVDDLGAVLVIALFYTADLNVPALAGGGAVLLTLIAMNKLGVTRPGAYALVGLVLWGTFLASGVHATIAGVLLAMTIPARTRIDTKRFLLSSREVLDEFDRAGVEGEGVLTNHGQQAAIQALEHNCEAAQAPLQRIEHDLQLWVAFGIIPLFALANAGVVLTGGFGEALADPVTLGIILGLVLGKPIGITLFSLAAVKSGLAVLPSSVGWKAIHGVSWLGGIGFTMSLFIGNLAFGEGSEMLDAAKIGILTASALAAVVGSILLRSATSRLPSPAANRL
jgi:NhaA family Na+:H+ antiporter